MRRAPPSSTARHAFASELASLREALARGEGGQLWGAAGATRAPPRERTAEDGRSSASGGIRAFTV